MGRHHTFPLPDRTGQRVIVTRTGKEGIIVGRGSCAYHVQIGDAVEVRSAYELVIQMSQQRPHSGPAAACRREKREIRATGFIWLIARRGAMHLLVNPIIQKPPNCVGRLSFRD